MPTPDPFAGPDPFAALDDEQRTYVKPRPGGRPAAGPRGPTPDARGAGASEPAPKHGLNPLVAVANRLLLLVPPLRATRRVDDVAALRDTLAASIRDFAAEAAAEGVPSDRVLAARYVLCTMIDEAASDTPWGGSGAWAGHSLLAMFHNEVQGGEKVFQLMARLAEKPAEHLDLLELIYAALALGFEGRYRVIPNGRAQLEAVRSKLAEIIRKARGDYAHALAEHWETRAVRQRRVAGWLPLVATAAVALLVLTLAYLGFRLSIESYSDPVFARLQGLQVAPTVVAPPRPAPVPRLAQLLAEDIRASLVAVRDDVDKSVVTIRGDGTFESGSATLVPAREALMGRIADAIAQLPGDVLVEGYTDNQPIRSLSFPSNYHLSAERAKAVARVMAAHRVDAMRIRTEGRGEASPLKPNDTPANRATNRRVEVTLFVPDSAVQASR